MPVRTSLLIPLMQATCLLRPRARMQARPHTAAVPVFGPQVSVSSDPLRTVDITSATELVRGMWLVTLELPRARVACRLGCCPQEGLACPCSAAQKANPCEHALPWMCCA